MGCLHAALFAEAGLSVVLLDHDPDRATAIRREGLRVTFPGTDQHTVKVPCTAEPLGLSAELLLVFTKAYDTESALAFAAPAIGAQTTVLTLQNGLGNYETISRQVGPDRVLAGSTSSGATLTGVGEIRVASIGEAVFGSPSGNRARAAEAAAFFEQAGLVARLTDDVDAALWRKAILNAAINPLGALTRRRNGELLEVPELRALLGRVATESHAIALGLGLALEGLDPVATVEQVCRDTATNQCSMLQDVLAGRRTEIAQINGEILRRAQSAEIPAPLNEALVALIEGVQ